MYKHHEQSIDNMIEYFKNQGAIALILGGSVAKGTEREDSDLDGMVILTEKDYQLKEKNNTTTETINGLCTYDNGYFDVKYMTKNYLKELAQNGSEPARNAFYKAKILFTNDEEINKILPQIPVFQKSEKGEKLLSFYSDFWMNYYYFVKCCTLEGYMKMRTIAEIIYDVYRIILQENEILFECNRRLEVQVKSISNDTLELVELARKLENSQNMQDIDAFIEKFLKITSYVPPLDINEIFTTYSKDFQEWWRVPRPNISEW